MRKNLILRKVSFCRKLLLIFVSFPMYKILCYVISYLGYCHMMSTGLSLQTLSPFIFIVFVELCQSD